MRISRWILLITVVLMAGKPAYTGQQYINDVRSGKQVACKFVKLAVERHLRDLERAGSDDFPYYFDEKQAKRIIDFKQELRHTQGEWADPRRHDTRIHLEPWQQFKDWVLFGWRKLDGTRRFTKAYIEVARKNGKTTDGAGTANYCYFADRPREFGPQVYCVATKKEQAHIAWDEMDRQIKKHPLLKKLARVYRQNSVIVLHADPAAKCTVWGKDSGTQDGFSPSFALIDEAHAYPDNQMMEVIESGEGSRAQPLNYIITTAGLDIRTACYQEERTLAVQVLERTIDPVPENFFALIFTLDEGDDWTDRTVWPKANPNLGVSVSWEYLEARVQQALQMPSRQNQILTKNFNIWTQSETRWIAAEAWDACKENVDTEGLAGRRCYAGLDLSTVIDLTAYALVFPPLDVDPFYRFLWRFFIPGDDLIGRERRDKVPYIEWVRRGLITTTPGNVIDYDFIEQRFLEDAKKYEIQEIAFDPWKAQEIVNHLTEGGFTMVPIQQRYSGMASPTEQFERLVLAKQIAHGGNPVMTWMVACTDVKSDRQGNIMPMKPERNKSGKRIDGVVAAIMALDRAVRNQGGDSIYQDKDLLVI